MIVSGHYLQSNTSGQRYPQNSSEIASPVPPCAGASKALYSVGWVDSFELILDGGREGGATKDVSGTGSGCSILKAGSQDSQDAGNREGGARVQGAFWSLGRFDGCAIRSSNLSQQGLLDTTSRMESHLRLRADCLTLKVSIDGLVRI